MILSSRHGSASPAELLHEICVSESKTTIEDLASALVSMGCPPQKATEMAQQLDKRARQLAEQKGRPYEQALLHLLALMRQGWSAKEKGL